MAKSDIENQEQIKHLSACIHEQKTIIEMLSINKTHLERLMGKAQAVRDAQTLYFKSKNDVNLRLSKAAEGNLDAYLRHLTKMGYMPEKPASTSNQKLSF